VRGSENIFSGRKFSFLARMIGEETFSMKKVPEGRGQAFFLKVAGNKVPQPTHL
jgi:hypothetical protein